MSPSERKVMIRKNHTDLSLPRQCKGTPDFNWKDLIARGDVVKFRFPVSDETAQEQQPKRRPCLVLDIIQRNSMTFIELAYGTSSDGRANRGYEVRNNRADPRAAAGLDKPTRFVCAR